MLQWFASQEQGPGFKSRLGLFCVECVGSFYKHGLIGDSKLVVGMNLSVFSALIIIIFFYQSLGHFCFIFDPFI